MLRELSSDVIDFVLRNQFFGRIGCYADGQVLILPVAYMYDDDCLYGQTREGTKTRVLRQNPAVCFEVDEICSPTSWRSVLIQGQYEELTGDERLYIEKRLGPGRTAPRLEESVMASATAERPVIVYRIRIISKTGRSETKEWDAEPSVTTLGSRQTH